eukprot:m.284776 g.284776  ORF g.284776 m.284776 type:complete len:50 (+) comp54964_c1_seq105:1136-1285(+)
MCVCVCSLCCSANSKHLLIIFSSKPSPKQIISWGMQLREGSSQADCEDE